MKLAATLLLVTAAATPLAYAVLAPNDSLKAQGTPSAPAYAGPVTVNPDRTAYFGDLHLHTTNSFDAYVLMGTKVTPDEAYKFGRGDAIDFLGQAIRKAEPLDFLAVTDHSENIGVFNQLDDPNSEFAKSEIGQIARKGGIEPFMKIVALLAKGTPLPGNNASVAASAWARNIAAANNNYQPGKFTTFLAYEWTSMPDGQNMHRNVIFKGAAAPSPFTSADSRKPEDLWAYLAKVRAQGFEGLAIPHNMNASNGLMYDWNTLDGRPIDEAWAQLRATNEPIAEISQNKGTSETHPALSSNDEFAGFELFDRLLISDTKSKPGGSYWRDGLGRGLVLQRKLGINPYKDGAIGSSDLHGGLSVQAENDYGGIASANLGKGRMDRSQTAQALGLEKASASIGNLAPKILSGGSLTGAWAESNTRDSLYAAFRRKETFATSGTRIKLRFFGGWNLASNLTERANWVHTAYENGVPMGGDLTAGKGVPSFAIESVKDANSGNLDRVQVVKVWLENGQQKERVFDVAWSGARRADPRTGKVPAVGDTVDLETGRYTNTIGAARLATVWRDPTFRTEQAAVYYVRVLEIPTPRWTTLRAIEQGLPLPSGVPATIQERAWSSPIWYTPPPRG